MSVQQARRVGIVAAITICIALVVVLAFSVRLTARVPASPEPEPNAQPAPLVAQQVRIALHRAGLTPQRLAAAGASPSQAQGVVAGTVEYLAAHTGPEVLDAAAGTARAEVARLERLVRSGQSAAQDVTDLASARTTLAQAEASRDAELGALFQAATGALPEPQRKLLAAMRTNEYWTMPPEFLTIDLGEPQRVALRDALANERISTKKGEAPDPAAQALLQEIRADSTVSLAKASLDANHAMVQAAWEQAVEQIGGTP